jgi:rhamnogalacturonan endolyase
MDMKRISSLAARLLAAMLPLMMPPAGEVRAAGDQAPAVAPRQMEKLSRGLIAVNQGNGRVYVGWRLLGTDPQDIAFNLYRFESGSPPVRLNREPISRSNDFVDEGVKLSQPTFYTIRPVIAGEEQPAGQPFALPANAPVRQYLSIPLRTPAGYTPNDVSVGDLDGDGDYEIVLLQSGGEVVPGAPVAPPPPLLEAYRLNGTFLWRINLGKNIRSGSHYTQFMVYDLDGDGKAEVACKTADATIDGVGKVIGDANADHRVMDTGSRDYMKVRGGPEFLTIFEGLTGKALATTAYIPATGKWTDWGDATGNRADRFLACVAYLDGVRPSLVMCRGYYGSKQGMAKNALVAWDWRDRKLTHRWTFLATRGTGQDQNPQYVGQGNHNLAVGDVDGDGKDEIVYGACCIDDNGRGLYSTGWGHGDAMHLSKMDPDLPGLQVFQAHEAAPVAMGATFRDAGTGRLIWARSNKQDTGRAMAADIDPRYQGYECWAGGGVEGLISCKGVTISKARPYSVNFGVWWDGDLLRELLDGIMVRKWDWEKSRENVIFTAAGCVANNGTKSTPALCADILGDWREEVVFRTSDNQELRIYTTTIPSQHRLYTLMHDPQYRLSVAWQNVAYNQPTAPGFYLGTGMNPAPRPNITTVPGAQTR